MPAGVCPADRLCDGLVRRGYTAAAVHVPRKRLIDLPAAIRLRTRIREFGPAVIQVWGLSFFRHVLPLVWRWPGFRGTRPPPRLVLSPAWEPGEHPGLVGAADGWLLRSAERVIVRDPGDERRFRKTGVPAEKLVFIPPAAPRIDPSTPAEPAVVLAGLGVRVPADTRVLLAAAMVYGDGGRAAVWAMGILSFFDERYHLVLAGDGPDLPVVRSFARRVGIGRRVHVVPPAALSPGLVRAAEVLLLPQPDEFGRAAALLGMAVGRAAVAVRHPVFESLVADGETGLFFPPGGPADLARQARRLLDQSALRERLGAAARERAAAFSEAGWLGRHETLYQPLGT